MGSTVLFTAGPRESVCVWGGEKTVKEVVVGYGVPQAPQPLLLSVTKSTGTFFLPLRFSFPVFLSKHLSLLLLPSFLSLCMPIRAF